MAQARPLRRENGQLYRCSHRPGDTRVSPPYELEEVERNAYSLHREGLHFSVERNTITIHSTDASPANRLPPPLTLAKGRHTIHSRVIPFREGDQSGRKWRETLGELIAVVMFGKTKDGVPFPPLSLSE